MSKGQSKKNNTTSTKYEGTYNLLRVEKNSIIRQLIKSKGVASEAHKVLCPKGNDPYNYLSFLKVIKKHDIKLKDYVIKVDKVRYMKEYMREYRERKRYEELKSKFGSNG